MKSGHDPSCSGPALSTSRLFAPALLTLALIAAAGPWSKAWIALLAGIALGLLGLLQRWPWLAKRARPWSRHVMITCIVLLGLRIDLHQLAHAAIEGLVLAIATIFGALGLGLLLGRVLGVEKEIRLLVSSGTAICGGSAIAAVGSAIGASSAGMAISTGCVFILNAVALLVFPPLGHALGLSEAQFGTWAGVAIHDMSSVAAAGSGYQVTPGSTVAADTANVVKLTRVIWIVALVVFGTWWMRPLDASGAPVRLSPSHLLKTFPTFIIVFVLASVLRTFVPEVARLKPVLDVVTPVGFAIALYLIGLGINKDSLKKVGWRALVLGVVLWVSLSSVTLAAIKLGWA